MSVEIIKLIAGRRRSAKDCLPEPPSRPRWWPVRWPPRSPGKIFLPTFHKHTQTYTRRAAQVKSEPTEAKNSFYVCVFLHDRYFSSLFHSFQPSFPLSLFPISRRRKMACFSLYFWTKATFHRSSFLASSPKGGGRECDFPTLPHTSLPPFLGWKVVTLR